MLVFLYLYVMLVIFLSIWSVLYDQYPSMCLKGCSQIIEIGTFIKVKNSKWERKLVFC